MYSLSPFIWFIVFGSSFILNITSAEKLDLKGKSLNVSVNAWPPFCDFEVVNNQIVFKQSIEVELLKVLESHFNFKANLIDEKLTFGNQINGKHWDGVVGHVINKVSLFILISKHFDCCL